MSKKVSVVAVGTLLVLLVGVYGLRDRLPQGVRDVVRRAPFVAEVLNVIAGRSSEAIGDGRDAIHATLNDPAGLYVDTAGSIYVSDRRHHRVRKIVDGVISTVAGTGARGFSGDGGSATSARVDFPTGLDGDSLGNLFIADTRNNRIRRLSAAGNIFTVAGDGRAGFAGDGGSALAASLRGPFDVRVSPAGALYIADTENHRIRLVSPDGAITTVAGTGAPGFSGDGGRATSAALNTPYSVALDGQGNVYVADSENHRIRKISPDGLIHTIAGTGEMGYSGDGGPATLAQLNSPQFVFITPVQEIYIGDEHNHRIRKISPSGAIVTVAGNGEAGFGGDGGPATEALFNDPECVWVLPSGEILVADGDNHRIRLVGPDGIVTTIVGAGTEASR